MRQAQADESIKRLSGGSDPDQEMLMSWLVHTRKARPLLDSLAPSVREFSTSQTEDLMIACGMTIGVLYVWTYFAPDRNRATRFIAWLLSRRWVTRPLLPARESALIVGIVCLALGAAYCVLLIVHLLRLL